VIIRIITLLLVLFSFSSRAGDNVVRIGVTAGPHAEIMSFIKTELSKEKLDIKIIEFSDFVLPNIALDQGDIDANSYQHIPFLDEQIKARGYKFAVIAKTILLPMGGYSKKIKSLVELRRGAKIGIPNDPTNEGRALLVLEKNGLIRLKDPSNLISSKLDIIENKLDIDIVTIEAPQLPRALDDLDLAVINTDWAMISGLDDKLKIISEDTRSPYTNVIVASESDKDSPNLKELISLYHTEKVKEFIKNKYKGAVIAAW
jgi:D-methionine transport system substrate-binding protein